MRKPTPAPVASTDVIAPHVLEAIRAAWRAYDDARDANDYGLARSILAGLDARAKALGFADAWALANR